MGMSHDFEVAVEEGATLVRVGTAIFGAKSGPTAAVEELQGKNRLAGAWTGLNKTAHAFGRFDDLSLLGIHDQRAASGKD